MGYDDHKFRTPGVTRQKAELRYHQCKPQERRKLFDARGIFCCFVCDECEQTKRSRYRPEIFTNPNYWTDEPVDPEED